MGLEPATSSNFVPIKKGIMSVSEGLETFTVLSLRVNESIDVVVRDFVSY